LEVVTSAQVTVHLGTAGAAAGVAADGAAARIVVIIAKTDRGVEISIAAKPRAVCASAPTVHRDLPVIREERAVADIAGGQADAQTIADEAIRAERNASGLDVVAGGAIAVTD